MHDYNRFPLGKNTLLIRLSAAAILACCILLLLAHTVLAQTTYVITEDNEVTVLSTDTRDPAAVLDEAGLALDHNDRYTLQAGENVAEISVQRMQSVQVTLNGKQMQAPAAGETVADFLDRMNIVVDENTRVSVPLDTLTYDGMALEVGYTVREVETYTVSIPFETVYRDDPALPAGQQQVVTPGVTGETQCLASVLYVDGKEVSRTLLNQEVIREPVTEVIALGSAAPVEETQEIEPIFGQTPEIRDGMIRTASGETLFYRDTMTIRASAYTKTDEGCNDFTATGSYARVGAIAVDPTVIPYGTRMFIVSDDGYYVYGIATAEDCGGAIIGDRVDLYFDTTAECFEFGRRTCTAYILG